MIYIFEVVVEKRILEVSQSGYFPSHMKTGSSKVTQRRPAAS